MNFIDKPIAVLDNLCLEVILMAHTTGPFELDHGKDGDSRYFIIHGHLPTGIKFDYGYPICDSMNRHHCVSPEEDEANGRLFAAAWDMREALKALWNSLTDGQRGCAGHFEASTPIVISYANLGNIKDALAKAGAL